MMKALARKPLEEIRAEEEQEKAKNAQLHNLGVSLAQEKAKNVVKDAQIKQLGQEFALMKAEILKLKGSAGE